MRLSSSQLACCVLPYTWPELGQAPSGGGYAAVSKRQWSAQSIPSRVSAVAKNVWRSSPSDTEVGRRLVSGAVTDLPDLHRSGCKDVGGVIAAPGIADGYPGNLGAAGPRDEFAGCFSTHGAELAWKQG